MDPDLLEEWRMQTADCSTKLMGTLITQAKRRMNEQITMIEQLTKDLEKISNQQEVSNQLAKMEERIKNKEEEIKSRKAHKFNRDRLDYEHGRIYTFAQKYDTARTKDVFKSGADGVAHHTSADDSSEIESSADEVPRNKLDFQGEMRLMQMVTPPPGQNHRRGRGSVRRGGWDYVSTRIELYKFVRKLRLIKHFSNKDKNRMVENANMRAAVSGFNIADSSQLMAINDLANESN
ncbi:hypothetical protein NDU88_005892 [Pleurodeles waltl]|uniref:Uncharacterized protein n=1 Tax=Pleurodeles waltl TaxID=8319 RepID=A0AAV7MEB4_PLEWA|nr:hypothetical protein NDU88_005892 [Pleurodeles waltl]